MSGTLVLTAVVLLTVLASISSFAVGRPENANAPQVAASGLPMTINNRTGPSSVYVRFGFVYAVQKLFCKHGQPSFLCSKHFETSNAEIAVTEGDSSSPLEPFRDDLNGNYVTALPRTQIENQDRTVAISDETSYVVNGERQRTVEAIIITSEDPANSTVVSVEDSTLVTIVDENPITKAFDCCFNGDNTTGTPVTTGFTMENDNDDHHHDYDHGGYDDYDRGSYEDNDRGGYNEDKPSLSGPRYQKPYNIGCNRE